LEAAAVVTAGPKAVDTLKGPLRNLPAFPVEVAADDESVVLEAAIEDWFEFEEVDESATLIGSAPPISRIPSRDTEAKIIFFLVESKVR
jgi:hypothetical protein